MTNKMTTTNLDTIQQAYNKLLTGEITQEQYAEIYDANCWRENSIETDYFEHKSELQGRGLSVEDHLYEELGVTKEDLFTTTTSNSYPYYLPDGYKHDVIWCSDSLANPYLINNIAISYLEKEDFYLWQAPESSRSVKEISHFHLIHTV